ncbi:hypothetical protein CYY_007215 [Polysphondylium violaceum]|uniref:Carbohydrate binding domain-containing protein n=1 Tax=Polysphondylium violaceum TaxID=133409 RepID=A0A8J4V2F2_9MYCE|nr:hypothetical protein CYY_007215 [Polysphondylium violaceum]
MKISILIASVFLCVALVRGGTETHSNNQYGIHQDENGGYRIQNGPTYPTQNNNGYYVQNGNTYNPNQYYPTQNGQSYYPSQAYYPTNGNNGQVIQNGHTYIPTNGQVIQNGQSYYPTNNNNNNNNYNTPVNYPTNNNGQVIQNGHTYIPTNNNNNNNYNTPVNYPTNNNGQVIQNGQMNTKSTTNCVSQVDISVEMNNTFVENGQTYTNIRVTIKNHSEKIVTNLELCTLQYEIKDSKSVWNMQRVSSNVLTLPHGTSINGNNSHTFGCSIKGKQIPTISINNAICA